LFLLLLLLFVVGRQAGRQAGEQRERPCKNFLLFVFPNNGRKFAVMYKSLGRARKMTERKRRKECVMP
jgi:hypothetical protein